MSHLKYSPVGYAYQADNYCLDCIPAIAAASKGQGLHEVRNAETEDWKAVVERTYIQDDGCNCAECVLDRIASDHGIDRCDERSFDSGDFPKSIPYFNDIHIECDPPSTEYPNGVCDARCVRCHEVIDGVSQLNEPDLCPVPDNAKQWY